MALRQEGADGHAAVATPSPALVAALRRVLRPLVRVLIRNGVTFPSIAGLLKAVYVEEAERGFSLPGKPTTDSRVTLLTGVHRKDVSRLRGGGADAQEALSPSLGAQVLGRWIGHPDYRGEGGRPVALPRGRSDGPAPSFEGLVEAISKDIRPRALLDELLRAGLVHERPDGLLELVEAAHLPRGDHDKMAYWFGRNVADHIAAAAHNLSGAEPAFLERAAFHQGLLPESVRRLNEEAKAKGMETLVHLNALATRLGEADHGAPGATQRFVAGLYVYAEDTEGQPPC